MLKSEKVEFGDGHAKEHEEFENLDKAHKALESKFLALSKSHDNLQIQLTKELSRVPLMPIDAIPCATNPICEHGDLIEENKRLKAAIVMDMALGVLAVGPPDPADPTAWQDAVNGGPQKPSDPKPRRPKSILRVHQGK